MSRTRYEWTLCDYAIWTAGAVTVPIYETSSAEQVQWNLSDSRRGRRRASRPPRTRRCSTASAATCPTSRSVWQLDAGGLDQLAAAGREVPEQRARGPPGGASPPTAWRRSSTPRARPGGPRAASSPTATCSPSAARRARCCPSCSTAPAARCCSCRWPTSSPASCRSPASRPAPGWATPPTSRPCCPTSARSPHLPAVGAARVREGLQQRQAEGPRRRQGRDLRPRGGGRDRLVDGARHRAPRPGAPAAARAVRPARLQQAAGRHGRSRPVRRVGRRAAGSAARPLLPRDRHHDPRGLRPHRDQRAEHRQPARPTSASARSASRCPARRSAWPRTARSSSRATRCSGATGATRRRRPRSCATAGSRPATSARSTTPASCGSPAARRRSS